MKIHVGSFLSKVSVVVFISDREKENYLTDFYDIFTIVDNIDALPCEHLLLHKIKLPCEMLSSFCFSLGQLYDAPIPGVKSHHGRRLRRSVTTNERQLWDSGIIPYILDSKISGDDILLSHSLYLLIVF